MLRARDLVVRYASVVAVRGASLDLEQGTIAALVGPNGAGKTSLLGAIAGLVPARGEVWVGDRRVDGLPAHRRAAAGIALVPAGRRLFGRLTVAQNLSVGSVLVRGRRDARAAVRRIVDEFPLLAERADQRADTLSGGEAQLLMIARALVATPAVLLVDEPFEGLSQEATALVRGVLERVARAGASVLIASPDEVPGLSSTAIEHGTAAGVGA